MVVSGLAPGTWVVDPPIVSHISMKMAKTRYQREGVELEDPISVIYKYRGKYLHFTHADKLGINTRGKYPGLNPVGVYGHLITDEIIKALKESNFKQFSSSMESVNMYQNMFIFDFSGEMLDVNQLSAHQLDHMVEFFSKKGLIQTIRYGYNGKDILSDIINEVKTHTNIKNLHLASNVVLRMLGYSAIKGFISAGDPNEICVLDPSKIIVLDKINNPLFDKSLYDKSVQYVENISRAADAYYKKAVQP